MSVTSTLRLLLMLSTFTITSSCVGEHAGLLVQMCLRDDRDVDALIDLVMQSASRNGMEFFDRSAASQRELATLGKDPGYRLVIVSASRSDGLGVAAMNLGLSANEMAIAFTPGANAEGSAAFIQSVMNQLQARWNVRTVPAGRGAMKSAHCVGR